MAKRKCDNCGKEFEPREEWHRFCSPTCRDQASGSGRPSHHFPGQSSNPNVRTNFRFGPDYLKDGYFEKTENDCILRAEYLDQVSEEISKLLGSRGMKNHQMRRFFNKARGIQTKLKRVENFGAIKADIFSFRADVVYAVGRKVVPEEFKQFIDPNVNLAVQNECNFEKGFLRHFESVLAYFVYYFKE